MSGLSIRSINCPSSASLLKSTCTPPAKVGKENLSHSLSLTHSGATCNASSSKLDSPIDYTNISLKEEPMEMKPKVKNPLFVNKSLNEIPIPKGNTAYSRAKRAEYVERDLAKAEKYYKIAIRHYERLDSAIKDLATVLHQQGKTEEACKFLEEYRHLYRGDKVKYENLLINLRKQIVPSGNCLNRTLVLFDLPPSFSQREIKDIFTNSSRILQIEVKKGVPMEDAPTSQNRNQNKTISENLNGRYCLIHFASYSAARKTLETLRDSQTFQLYWMNIYGKLAGKAELTKQPIFTDEGSTDTATQQESEANQIENKGPGEVEERKSQKPIEIPMNSGSPVNEESKVFQSGEVSGKKQAEPIIAKAQEQKKCEESLHKVGVGAKEEQKISQPCWQNCVLLGLNQSAREESCLSDSKFDVHQDFLLKRITFKVFENEDKPWDFIYWRRLLRRSHPLEREPMEIPKSPLWETIKKKENEIKLGLVKEPNFVNRLLQTSSQAQREQIIHAASSKLEKLGKNTTNPLTSSDLSKYFPQIQRGPQGSANSANRGAQILAQSQIIYPERPHNMEYIPLRPSGHSARFPGGNFPVNYYRGNNNPLVQSSFVYTQESEPQTPAYYVYNRTF